jgi:hypothetical protein
MSSHNVTDPKREAALARLKALDESITRGKAGAAAGAGETVEAVFEPLIAKYRDMAKSLRVTSSKR